MHRIGFYVKAVQIIALSGDSDILRLAMAQGIDLAPFFPVSVRKAFEFPPHIVTLLIQEAGVSNWEMPTNSETGDIREKRNREKIKINLRLISERTIQVSANSDDVIGDVLRSLPLLRIERPFRDHAGRNLSHRATLAEENVNDGDTINE